MGVWEWAARARLETVLPPVFGKEMDDRNEEPIS
jgi:hypothetical protein